VPVHMQKILPRLRRAAYSYSSKLPRIQPQDILEGYADLKITIPFISTHWETATLFDHTFIASLVHVVQPRTCLEIGTSLGLVTSTIASNAPDDTEIHTIDQHGDERIGSFFRSRPEGRKIRQHVSLSTKFDFRPYAGSVDLMFIDGSHEFEDVRRDSENAFNVLTDRGVVIWHDVTPYFPGVMKALEASANAGEIYRVQGTSCGFYAAPNAPLKMRSGVVAQTLAMV
jgi:predicted O-methyltransferase YrrM